MNAIDQILHAEWALYIRQAETLFPQLPHFGEIFGKKCIHLKHASVFQINVVTEIRNRQIAHLLYTSFTPLRTRINSSHHRIWKGGCCSHCFCSLLMQCTFLFSLSEIVSVHCCASTTWTNAIRRHLFRWKKEQILNPNAYNSLTFYKYPNNM